MVLLNISCLQNNGQNKNQLNIAYSKVDTFSIETDNIIDYTYKEYKGRATLVIGIILHAGNTQQSTTMHPTALLLLQHRGVMIIVIHRS